MNARSPRPKAGAVTIADVAAASGFSPMTVSRVINNDTKVRESTRLLVKQAIAALNYSPNIAARTLAGADPVRIGLLYSNPSAAYLSRYLLGSLEQARAAHVELIVVKCDTDEQAEEDAISELLSSGVDGIILSEPMCASPRVLALFDQFNTQVVAVGNWRPSSRMSVVRIDDREAAAEMTRHIISLGHRHIGFIIGNALHKASEMRRQGFEAAMQEAGISVSPAYLVQGHFTYRSGLEAAEALLALPERPTAIFASNDDMAAATIAVAHRRHLDVPRDLTVCGFDDTDFAQSIWPELTTIHQPIAEMSRAAVDMLTEQIRAHRAGREETARDQLLDYKLVLRDSDGPPGEAASDGGPS
jgi:LacI family transcriptional regulator